MKEKSQTHLPYQPVQPSKQLISCPQYPKAHTLLLHIDPTDQQLTDEVSGIFSKIPLAYLFQLYFLPLIPLFS